MSRAHAPDYRLLLAIGIWLVFGLIMLSSAGSAIGYADYHDTYYFLKRQILLGVLPGLAAGYVIYRLGYHKLQKLAVILFAASCVLLALVFVPHIGLSYGTFAHRWIHLGPVNFQPSELAKISFILFLAVWLSGQRERLQNFKEAFIPFCIFSGIVIGLIILEPDLGTASVLALIALALYFVAGGRLRYVGLLLLAAAVGLAILIYFEPYRLNRLNIFLHPELDPQGIGYQVNQAFVAIGSGGLFGRGFGSSRAKFQYLPEVTGDSIFAVIAEELGFVTVVAFLLLIIYIFLRGLKLAIHAPDDFGRLVTVGILVWFVGQSLVNICAMIGLLPLTGIPLPFVSYGGTALAMAIAAVGILASVSSEARN